MPRALLSRGQKNLLPKRYSILTIALSDSHHGVTRYPRATLKTPFDKYHVEGCAVVNGEQGLGKI